MFVLTALLVSTHAADLGEQTQERLLANGPLIAHYVSADTGAPWLDVHLAGPDAFSVIIHGDNAGSVGATADRLVFDVGSCGRFEAKRVFQSIQEVSIGEPLFERTHPEMTLAVRDGKLRSTVGHQMGSPRPVFSWLGQLDDADAIVVHEGSELHATLDGQVWTVSEKTGLLLRLEVGDDALVLDRVVRGKKARTQVVRPEALCEAPQRDLSFSADMRREVLAGYLGEIEDQWLQAESDAERRVVEQAMELQWSRFFADDLPGWAAEVPADAWQDQLRARVVDVDAFRAYRAGGEGRTVASWRTHLLYDVGTQMLQEHLDQSLGLLKGDLKAHGHHLGDDAMDALVGRPMSAAINAGGGELIEAMLTPVLDDGVRQLEAQLQDATVARAEPPARP